MASTSILNHYRNLIVSDKELFTLLTIIFKEGDVSEKSLLQRTNFTPSVLKLSLDNQIWQKQKLLLNIGFAPNLERSFFQH
jgi:hypothetical protein